MSFYVSTRISTKRSKQNCLDLSWSVQGSLLFHMCSQGGRENIQGVVTSQEGSQKLMIEMQFSIIHPLTFGKIVIFWQICPGRYSKVMIEWWSLDQSWLVLYWPFLTCTNLSWPVQSWPILNRAKCLFVRLSVTLKFIEVLTQLKKTRYCLCLYLNGSTWKKECLLL